LFVYDYK